MRPTLFYTLLPLLGAANPLQSRDAQNVGLQSSDTGRCGKAFGGASCDLGCCSTYGYCGTTDQYCIVELGCQSQCRDANNVTLLSSDQPSPAEMVTVDGTCGLENGNTICGNWPRGSCCSTRGWCGNTYNHCGPGCQSGPCLGGAPLMGPAAKSAPQNANPGSFQVVGRSGVPAMHAALMPNGRVMFLDKVENYTQLKLPNGEYAYSSEYDPATNQVVPLAYKTNAFCAGGSFLADGRLLVVGGNEAFSDADPTVGNGLDAVRYLSRSASDPSLDGQDWSEPGNKLASARWYPSVQTLPDGSIFVASGSLNGYNLSDSANNNPTFETLNAEGITNGNNYAVDLLQRNVPYYTYPFVHLLKDGNLFLFTSKSSNVFSVQQAEPIRSLPDLPGEFRTYPNTGGSVLLPLSSANDWNPDIMICGGGAYQGTDSPADASCGRIQPLSANPEWEMDSMPEGRDMVEGTLLPDGTTIWMNGAMTGGQGFNIGRDPALEVLIYDPAQPLGQRFTTGAISTIPRLYHSVALLLLDGTVMVAGSNPFAMPVLAPPPDYPYITEFRVEVYTPPYLQGEKASRRPTKITLSSLSLKADGSTFTVSFTALAGAKSVTVVLYHGGFVTHSLHMSQRMAVLDTKGWQAGATQQTVTATMPPNSNVAPPGPYVVYVVVDGVPGIGQFVMVS